MREALLAGESTRPWPTAQPARRLVRCTSPFHSTARVGLGGPRRRSAVPLELARGAGARHLTSRRRLLRERREKTESARAESCPQLAATGCSLPAEKSPTSAPPCSSSWLRGPRRPQHARENRGQQVRAVFATRLEASLAIDAMRSTALCFQAPLEDDPRLPGDGRAPPVVRLGNDRPIAAFCGGALIRVTGSTVRWRHVDPGFADAALFPGPFPYFWTKLGALHPRRRRGRRLRAQLRAARLVRGPPGRLADGVAHSFSRTRVAGISLLRTLSSSARRSRRRACPAPRGEPLAVTGTLPRTPRALVSLLPAAGGRARGSPRFSSHVGRASSPPSGSRRDPRRRSSGRRAREICLLSRRPSPRLRAAHDPRIEVDSRLVSPAVPSVPAHRSVHVCSRAIASRPASIFASAISPSSWRRPASRWSTTARWVDLDDGTFSASNAQLETSSKKPGAVMG